MKRVTIYSTQTCPYCRAEKAWLNEQGIAYTEVDVSFDRAKQEEMIDKSGQMGVPVTVISDDHGSNEVVVGFDQPKLASLLGK